MLEAVGPAVLATATLVDWRNGVGGIPDDLGFLFHVAVLVAAIALNPRLFSLGSKMATAREFTWEQVRLRAIAAATVRAFEVA